MMEFSTRYKTIRKGSLTWPAMDELSSGLAGSAASAVVAFSVVDEAGDSEGGGVDSLAVSSFAPSRMFLPVLGSTMASAWLLRLGAEAGADADVVAGGAAT